MFVSAARPLLKACLVFVGICLQGVILYSCSVVSSTFYVTHLTSRGVSNFQVGLIGMLPGVGCIITTFYDVTDYFIRSKKIYLKKLQGVLLACIIINCAGQGIAELVIPTNYNHLLVIVLGLQRCTTGYLAALSCKTQVDCCRTWFPDHVSLTVGLQNGAQYVGGALAILMSGYVYESLGFAGPFLVLGCANIIFWFYNLAVLPKSSYPVYESKLKDTTSMGQSENKVRDQPLPQLTATKKSTQGLTWLIIIPKIAQSLTVGLEGFSSAITTPYLNDKFDVPIGQGGSYVFTQYVSLTLGSAASGTVMQLNWASPNTIISGGSFLTLVGILLMFPDPRVPFLYQIVTKVAYFATFLQGLGIQLINIAALMAIEDVQVILANRPYTTKNKSIATTLWLVSWMMSVYGGHMIALMVMEFMSYEQGGVLMAGCSFLSIIISMMLAIATKRARATKVLKVQPLDVEKTSDYPIRRASVYRSTSVHRRTSIHRGTSVQDQITLPVII